MKAAYTQQLLDRAQAYVEQPLTARRYDEGLTEISALYADITGEPVGKCRQCQYQDFMAVVAAYIREATRFLHPETVKNSKYTFAAGFANEQIADPRYNKVVTSESLEDADAEQLIKLGYGHVIVLKPGQEESAEGESSTEVAHQNPLVPQADLEKEQQAHQATAKQLEDAQAANAADKQKAADTLKTEKDAHKATKTELTATKKHLAEVSKELADALAKVDELSKPAAPADGSTVVTADKPE